MSFFVTGDEWGLAEIMPVENEEFYREISRQAFEHHKDTEFGPHGWTTPPFMIPPPRVSLSDRAIRLTELEELFAGVLVRADRVETCEDFTGKPFEAMGCYAFAGHSDDGSFSYQRAGLYGDVKDGIVSTLYTHYVPFEPHEVERVAEVLCMLGARYKLILVWEGSWIISMVDRREITKLLVEMGDYFAE